jgi:hypothetical protein
VAECTSNDGRQTGGPRQIVSTRTVFDDDLHGGFPRMRRYGVHSRCRFHDSRRPVIWLEFTASMWVAATILAHPSTRIPRGGCAFERRLSASGRGTAILR